MPFDNRADEERQQKAVDRLMAARAGLGIGGALGPGARQTTVTTFGFQAGEDGFVRYGTDSGTRIKGGREFIKDGVNTGWYDYIFKLAAGGRGGGKSKGGGLTFTDYALKWRGGLGIITAPTYYTMYGATLPALFWAFEQFGLVKDKDYHYTHTREEIDLHPTDFKILLRTTEKPERLRGPDGAIAWMDEARDSPKESFETLQPTIRQGGYPHHFIVTTTPAGKLQWIYPTWFQSRTGIGTYKHWFAATRDNPYGGEENYLQSIQTLGENSLKARQELFGEFIIMEGLVYEDWDPSIYLRDESEFPEAPIRYIGGIDFGFRDPSTILIIGIDRELRQYVVDEWYKTGVSEEELIEKAYELQQKYGVTAFACDASAPRWIRGLRQSGVRAMPAYKRVTATQSDPSHGIGLCARAMKYRLMDRTGLASQGFFVLPKCQNFRDEVESYIWEEPKPNLNLRERPHDKWNHVMDAWRYVEEFISWTYGIGSRQSQILRSQSVRDYNDRGRNANVQSGAVASPLTGYTGRALGRRIPGF